MNLKNLLFKNLGWKLGALVLSLALWFHIATEKVYERQFPAKIEITRLSANLKITDIEPSGIDISFLGTGKQLLQLMLFQDVLIPVDLSGITKPGEYNFDLKPSELSDVDVASFKNVTFLNGSHIKIVIGSKS